MRVHFATTPSLSEHHLVLTLEHIAKMRRDLRRDIEEAGGLEKMNRHYIDGINHVLDAMESAMIHDKE